MIPYLWEGKKQKKDRIKFLGSFDLESHIVSKTNDDNQCQISGLGLNLLSTPLTILSCGDVSLVDKFVNLVNKAIEEQNKKIIERKKILESHQAGDRTKAETAEEKLLKRKLDRKMQARTIKRSYAETLTGSKKLNLTQRKEKQTMSLVQIQILLETDMKDDNTEDKDKVAIELEEVKIKLADLKKRYD